MFQKLFQFLNRNYFKWWFRPLFLRISKKKKILFAGPWVGEFGWELFHWQGFVRNVSQSYQRVIICCRKGQEGLYKDFCSEFVYHEIKGVSECDQIYAIENPEELQRLKILIPKNSHVLKPIGALPFSRQEFIRFGNKDVTKKYDIVFHPRGRSFETARNWIEENWSDLLEQLLQKGYTVACIGLTKDTLSLKVIGFDDYRDVPIASCFDLLASSQLLIGPSSGPMHLGSLCGISHLVWTDKKKYAKGEKNRFKYEKSWNPLKTRAYVLDDYGFKPPVMEVFKAINRILKDQ